MVQEGRLLHGDMAKIWSKYPSNMLQWLVRLTEEFDLTFPIPDEHCNIVPCLLPPEPPQVRHLFLSATTEATTGTTPN